MSLEWQSATGTCLFIFFTLLCHPISGYTDIEACNACNNKIDYDIPSHQSGVIHTFSTDALSNSQLCQVVIINLPDTSIIQFTDTDIQGSLLDILRVTDGDGYVIRPVTPPLELDSLVQFYYSGSTVHLEIKATASVQFSYIISPVRTLRSTNDDPVLDLKHGPTTGYIASHPGFDVNFTRSASIRDSSLSLRITNIPVSVSYIAMDNLRSDIGDNSNTCGQDETQSNYYEITHAGSRYVLCSGLKVEKPVYHAISLEDNGNRQVSISFTVQERGTAIKGFLMQYSMHGCPDIPQTTITKTNTADVYNMTCISGYTGSRGTRTITASCEYRQTVPKLFDYTWNKTLSCVQGGENQDDIWGLQINRQTVAGLAAGNALCLLLFLVFLCLYLKERQRTSSFTGGRNNNNNRIEMEGRDPLHSPVGMSVSNGLYSGETENVYDEPVYIVPQNRANRKTGNCSIL